MSPDDCNVIQNQTLMNDSGMEVNTQYTPENKSALDVFIYFPHLGSFIRLRAKCAFEPQTAHTARTSSHLDLKTHTEKHPF